MASTGWPKALIIFHLSWSIGTLIDHSLLCTFDTGRFRKNHLDIPWGKGAEAKPVRVKITCIIPNFSRLAISTHGLGLSRGFGSLSVPLRNPNPWNPSHQLTIISWPFWQMSGLGFPDFDKNSSWWLVTYLRGTVQPTNLGVIIHLPSTGRKNPSRNEKKRHIYQGPNDKAKVEKQLRFVASTSFQTPRILLNSNSFGGEASGGYFPGCNDLLGVG